MMSSSDWNFYNTYRRQIETFQSKTKLTDLEFNVMTWMRNEVKRLEKMQKVEERN